jgi:hypothetical protein
MASNALAVIDVPSIRPPGVTKRQWRLAALLPRCETAAEALRLAGYAELTIDRMARPTLGTLGVRRASQAIAAAKSDSAREIKRKAGAFVSQALDAKEADPTYALNAWATASKIATDYPDEEQGVGPGERSDARDYIHNLIRFALAAAKDHELSDEEIDSISMRAPQDLVLSPALDVTSTEKVQQVNDPQLS